MFTQFFVFLYIIEILYICTNKAKFHPICTFFADGFFLKIITNHKEWFYYRRRTFKNYCLQFACMCSLSLFLSFFLAVNLCLFLQWEMGLLTRIHIYINAYLHGALLFYFCFLFFLCRKIVFFCYITNKKTYLCVVCVF